MVFKLITSPLQIVSIFNLLQVIGIFIQEKCVSVEPKRMKYKFHHSMTKITRKRITLLISYTLPAEEYVTISLHLSITTTTKTNCYI